MNKIKRFLKTSLIYFIGSISSKFIAILLLPLYTDILSPEDFGRYDLVTTIISFFAPIAFFQIWDGMFRFSFDKSKYEEKYIIVTNSLSVMLLGIGIYSIIYLIAYNILGFFDAIYIYFLGVVIAMQYQYTFIARTFLKNKLFVFSGLVNTLVVAFSNIILLVYFNYGIDALYISSILGALVQIILIEIALRPVKNISIKEIDFGLQLDMIKFSFPLCVASISYWLLSGYTKVVISKQLGYYANGLYAVAFKFTAMITIVMTIFQYAWNEIAYMMADEQNRMRKYEKSINYSFRATIIGSCFFILCIKLIFPYVVDENYDEAIWLIPISLIGVAINAFGNFVGTIFMAEKVTRWILGTTVIAAIINIFSVWIFIYFCGLQGAIGALCISFIIIALLRLIGLRKLFNIKIINYGNISLIPLLILICVIYFNVENIFIIINIMLLVILFGVYLLREMLIPLMRLQK